MTQGMEVPIFSAVSSSARQLHTLLRCLGFSDKAIVQISDQGIRFSVHESSVMEGMAFLKKDLFSSYQYDPSAEEDAEVPPFSVSLSSIVEALQIFGVSETAKTPWERDSIGGGAFSAQVLGVSGICRIRYESVGSPFIVILEETGLSTRCELVTYEPPSTASIPFDRDDLELKVIMDASFINDAITELGSSNPSRIIFGATPKSFILSAPSDIGSAVIHFHRQDAEFSSTAEPSSDSGVLETFYLANERCKQSYKFAHVASTRRALASASKVSIRIDSQGVLSLQFMIENMESQEKSFVDFRLVPLISGEDNVVDNDVSDEEE